MYPDFSYDIFDRVEYDRLAPPDYTPPPRCPYCGSLETHGGACAWCRNDFKEEYI